MIVCRRGGIGAGEAPWARAVPQVYGSALRHEHRTNEWLGPRALLAAALLHGIALLMVVVPAERIAVPVAPLQGLPVTLLMAPETPPARPVDSLPELALLGPPADEAVMPSTEIDVVAGPVAAEDMSAPESEQAPRDTGGPASITRRPPQEAAAVAHHRTKKSAKKILAPEPPDAAAIYEVLIDADGSIRGVAVMRSSGVQTFDDAGKKMIYHDIHLPPPSHEPTTLRVTLHFSPEGIDVLQPR
jgi:TonB family protein